MGTRLWFPRGALNSHKAVFFSWKLSPWCSKNKSTHTNPQPHKKKIFKNNATLNQSSTSNLPLLLNCGLFWPCYDKVWISSISTVYKLNVLKFAPSFCFLWENVHSAVHTMCGQLKPFFLDLLSAIVLIKEAQRQRGFAMITQSFNVLTISHSNLAWSGKEP